MRTHFTSWCAVVWVLLFRVTGASFSADEPPSIDEVISAIVEERSRVSSGNVTFALTLTYKKSASRSITYSTDFDGERYRLRITEKRDGTRDNLGTTGTWTQTYIYNGRQLLTSLRPVDTQGPRMVATIAEKPNGIRTNGLADTPVLDPRTAGLVPFPFTLWSHADWREFLNAARQSEDAVASIWSDPDGKVLTEIRFTAPSTSKGRILADPEWGFLPVRIEWASEVPPNLYVDITECEPAEYPCGEETTRFPRSITVTRQTNGETLATERIETISAEFNRPIDPALFDIPGLNLAPDTLVSVGGQPEATGRYRIWTGEELRPIREQDHRERRLPENPVDPPSVEEAESGVWWISLVVLVNAGVLGLLFLWIRRFQG